MGFLDSVKAWFATEAAELADAKGDLEARLSTELSERERQINETPTEGLERLQSEIADNESLLGSLEDKIAHSAAKADALAEIDTADDADTPDCPSVEAE